MASVTFFFLFHVIFHLGTNIQTGLTNGCLQAIAQSVDLDNVIFSLLNSFFFCLNFVSFFSTVNETQVWSKVSGQFFILFFIFYFGTTKLFSSALCSFKIHVSYLAGLLHSSSLKSKLLYDICTKSRRGNRASDLTSSLSCFIYFTICSTMAYSPYELLPQFISLDFFLFCVQQCCIHLT